MTKLKRKEKPISDPPKRKTGWKPHQQPKKSKQNSLLLSHVHRFTGMTYPSAGSLLEVSCDLPKKPVCCRMFTCKYQMPSPQYHLLLELEIGLNVLGLRVQCSRSTMLRNQTLPAGFKAPLLPGILLASLFPGIIGSAFPGSIYASQTLSFRAAATVRSACFPTYIDFCSSFVFKSKEVHKCLQGFVSASIPLIVRDQAFFCGQHVRAKAADWVPGRAA